MDAGGVPLADSQSLSIYYGLTSIFLDRQSRSPAVVSPGIGVRRVWRVRSYFTHFYRVDGWEENLHGWGSDGLTKREYLRKRIPPVDGS